MSSSHQNNGTVKVWVTIRLKYRSHCIIYYDRKEEARYDYNQNSNPTNSHAQNEFSFFLLMRKRRKHSLYSLIAIHEMAVEVLTCPCKYITIMTDFEYGYSVWACRHLLTFPLSLFLLHTFLTKDMIVVTTGSLLAVRLLSKIIFFTVYSKVVIFPGRYFRRFFWHFQHHTP